MQLNGMAMTQFLLSIIQGTTHAILFGSELTPVAPFPEELPVYFPADNWVETYFEPAKS